METTKATHKKSIVSVRELCSIIRVAASHNVSKLTLGDLSIEFVRLPSYSPLEEPVKVPLEFEAPETLQTVQQNPPVQGRIADEREILDDIRLSQMICDDPEAFEQEVIDGHLHGLRERDEEARYSSFEQAVPGSRGG